MKNILYLILFLVSAQAISQDNLNQYKYVIVPESFEFLKEADQYQLNSLTQFLFEKYGFTALMENEAMPQDLQKDGCLALRSHVVQNKSLFTTKFLVTLKNCQNQTVFTSKVGKSKEKQYKPAYHEALREAFESVEALDYQYEATETVDAENATTTAEKVNEKPTSKPKIKMQKPIEKTAEKAEPQPKKPTAKQAKSFTARPKTGAFVYDLVDASGQVTYTIQFSGKEDVYIVKSEDAIIYKMNGQWVLATATSDSSLKGEAIDLSFPN